MSRPAPWKDAAHVLCVRLDAMGDVLMTTPAIRALKESRPGRRITLLTSGAAAARLVPEVDDYWTYGAPWMKDTPPRDDAAHDRAMIERVRAGRFAAAVIFTVFSQNPLPAASLCYLADIPLRVAHSRENPYGLLTDWVPEPEPDRVIRHEVRGQLDLVASIGARAVDERLSLRVPQEARERIDALLDAMGIEGDSPWAIIHPGATAPSRRYAPEGFAEAAGRPPCVTSVSASSSPAMSRSGRWSSRSAGRWVRRRIRSQGGSTWPAWPR
jgi:ADP-heptose:LPS heptosyltransferase